jgi:uncharacterized Zn finger protein (UPF0148 family)
MHTCSACGNGFRPEDGRSGESDTRFDLFCPNCGAGVIPDGDAEEIRRQRDVQREIINDIQELAEETKTASYEGPQHSIEVLRDRLQRILDNIDTELERRNE